MNRLIIIGTSPMSNIMFEYALKSASYKKDWIVYGFLSCDRESMDSNLQLPIIGDIDTYNICDGDCFICSVVNVAERETIINKIKGKGGKFVNIIHPQANISSSSTIGDGCFIGAFSTISVNSHIGDHVILQDYCSVGHDSSVGDFSHLFVRSTLCGMNNIGKSVAVYTSATICPLLTVEDNSIIGAGSVVVKKVKTGVTVFGNPARKI